MNKTGINWTDYTWNPITGCSKISEGCKNCYAETMANRLQKMHQKNYQNGFKLTTHEDVLIEPLQKKKSIKIFPCSMSDMFHQDVSDLFLRDIFSVMGSAPQHTFQVLTKRIDRAADFIKQFYGTADMINCIYANHQNTNPIPIPNIWLGATVENQANTKRLEILQNIPAAIRFASVEPMLSQITLEQKYNLDWIIIGCESGHKPRPCYLTWVRELVKQCKEFGIKIWIKQLDLGRVVEDINIFPEDLRIREFPI